MRDLAVYLTRSARTTKFRSFEGACAPFVGIVDAEKCLLFACACTVIWLLRFAYLPLHFHPLFTLTASGAATADDGLWAGARYYACCAPLWSHYCRCAGPKQRTTPSHLAP